MHESNPYMLSHGKHTTPDEGRCAMEWVSYLAGEEHSDQPVCASLILRRFCILLNDALPDDQRQRMRPYLARTIGTAGDGLDKQRQWMCADWLIRVYTPVWLDLVPDLKGGADALRALPPVLAAENVAQAMSDLQAARSEAARSEADAAGDAARDAAGDAAWDAAWDAAGDAACTAARTAAGAAACAAAWDAACAAARTAAGAAARGAACAAARGAAWGVARDAARATLKPVTVQLQDSILRPGGLLDRMLPTEVIQLPVVSEWREIVGAAS